MIFVTNVTKQQNSRNITAESFLASLFAAYKFVRALNFALKPATTRVQQSDTTQNFSVKRQLARFPGVFVIFIGNFIVLFKENYSSRVQITATVLNFAPRGGAVWQLVGLITRRSQVQILSPQPDNEARTRNRPGFCVS